MKYFKVYDNDIRQAIVYIATDLSFQEQLSWSKQPLRYEANLQGHKIEVTDLHILEKLM